MDGQTTNTETICRPKNWRALTDNTSYWHTTTYHWLLQVWLL